LSYFILKAFSYFFGVIKQTYFVNKNSFYGQIVNNLDLKNKYLYLFYIGKNT